MTHKINWLITVALAITCVASGYAEPDPTAEAIKSLAERNVRANQEENIDAVMDTIHTQAPSFLSMKKDMPSLFDNYDLSTELTSFAYIGQNDDYAVARAKVKITKISGPAFQNAEYDNISVFRKENDEWKYWTQVILDTKFLNE